MFGATFVLLKFAPSVATKIDSISSRMDKSIVLNNADVDITVDDKIAGPWVLESVPSRGPGSIDECYIIRSVPDKEQLALYYVPMGWDSNYYWTIVHPDLRVLADKYPACSNPSQFSPTGGFVDTQTQARDIIEGLLKLAGYRLVDNKLAVLA